MLIFKLPEETDLQMNFLGKLCHYMEVDNKLNNQLFPT